MKKAPLHHYNINTTKHIYCTCAYDTPRTHTHSSIRETITDLKRSVTGFNVVTVCLMSHSVGVCGGGMTLKSNTQSHLCDNVCVCVCVCVCVLLVLIQTDREKI